MEKPPLTCRVTGHNIAYHCDGDGKIILLVHGITTYSVIWRKMVLHNSGYPTNLQTTPAAAPMGTRYWIGK
jgi:pimeloyl-ACP methyl ester carboxylesterase